MRCSFIWYRNSCYCLETPCKSVPEALQECEACAEWVPPLPAVGPLGSAKAPVQRRHSGALILIFPFHIPFYKGHHEKNSQGALICLISALSQGPITLFLAFSDFLLLSLTSLGWCHKETRNSLTSLLFIIHF